MPMSLYGRRRCGKSWLFRRFAHEKPAVLLVARRTAAGVQLADFADKLEPLVGMRPALTSVPELFRTLYRAAREEKRERSHLKLFLCGSLVSQMESLLAERAPLHGRLVPLQLHPVAFPQARLFLAGVGVEEQFERYAVAGGMPRYLTALSGEAHAGLRALVCERMLNPNSALWDEGRAILEQELREPKVYFAILQALADGDKDVGEVASALRSDAQRVSKYLKVWAELRDPVRHRGGPGAQRACRGRGRVRGVLPVVDTSEPAGHSRRVLVGAGTPCVAEDRGAVDRGD
jgi:AAA+ ATPase superfamily predicted ATPase